jgi:PAS domain S-box-containing protein
MRPGFVAVSLVVRLIVSALACLMKVFDDIRGSYAGPLDRTSFEKVCETLKKSGGGKRKDKPHAKNVHGDLLEKNEYLRAVNEEIIKLTQSLEAANSELEETRDYLNNLIQNSADMIVSTGRRRIVTLFNRRAEEILDYRSSEVIGQPVDILYQQGEVERVETHLKQQPDGKLMEYEIALKTKGGRVIPARLTASLLYDRDGRLIGSVGACTDLTHIKALENEVLRQQKLLAIGELGGAACHELNQPLTVAMGRIQLIFRKEGKDWPYYRDLRNVEKELERMAGMITRIGKITRYKTKPYIGQSRIIDLERSVVTTDEGHDDLRQTDGPK